MTWEEKKLSSSNLYSHIDPLKLLEKHLINTAKISKEYFEDKNICTILNYKKDELMELIYIIGLVHDIGKSTKYFQDYLLHNGQKCDESNHGMFSAIIGLYIGDKYFNDYMKCFIIYETIKRHHGNLNNYIGELYIPNVDIYLKQLSSIDRDKFDMLVDILSNNGLPIKFDLKHIEQFIKDDLELKIKEIRRYLKKYIRSKKTFELYELVNLMFSFLIDSDKTEVAIGKVIKRNDLPKETCVSNYINKLNVKPSNLNVLRQKAYREANSLEIDITNRLYTLNLPTGLGKTLTSFSFALKLRNEIIKRSNNKLRIIYSLPFMSIIEQNASVFEKVLISDKVTVTNNILLKHHHLVESKYTDGKDNWDSSEGKLLIEGWNSEIIITTFVQLFHTLFSNKNKLLRKFHKISNSIIILDEIQALPLKYHKIVNQIFNEITERFNVYIIFSTATLPYFFQASNYKSIINKEYYFSRLNRVEIRSLISNKTTIEEFAYNLDIDEEKSHLFILNTISSASSLYSLIKTENSIFLSTHLTPKDRLDKIKIIKEEDIKLVVTTQLIEAGVDIDFDVIYRDIAPLDSINQSAGRCNRNGNKDKGIVNIINLVDTNDKTYANYVYDNILLDITRELLEDKQVIEEIDLLEVFNKYNLMIKERKEMNSESDKLMDAIYKLKYVGNCEEAAINNFKLIDSDYDKFNVFIEQDDKAQQCWEDYIRITTIKDVIKRYEEFEKIKADFYKYVISIPVNIDNKPPIVKDIGYVSYNDIDDYYDRETGYITKKTHIIW
jgi:CRISPR-associated endonuclease/helicase Cas3